MSTNFEHATEMYIQKLKDKNKRLRSKNKRLCDAVVSAYHSLIIGCSTDDALRTLEQILPKKDI